MNISRCRGFAPRERDTADYLVIISDAFMPPPTLQSSRRRRYLHEPPSYAIINTLFSPLPLTSPPLSPSIYANSATDITLTYTAIFINRYCRHIGFFILLRRARSIILARRFSRCRYRPFARPISFDELRCCYLRHYTFIRLC
jgi:hypothetical protein